MTLKCYDKPNRSKPRHFTAKDCGRIVCYAIEDGADKPDVRREVDRCLGGDEDCEKAYTLLQVLLGLLAAVLVVIGLLSSIGVIMRALLFLRNLLPREVVEYLEGTGLKKLEEEVRIKIDEVTELITRRKG